MEYRLVQGQYIRRTRFRTGDVFKPTPGEIRVLGKRLVKVGDEGAAETPPEKPLYRTSGRNPYQDVWLKGKTVAKGQRDCEKRYSVIAESLKDLPREFTVLDIGAAQGYFSFRLANDFGAACTLIDRDECLLNIIAANGFKNMRGINRSLNARQIAEIVRAEKYDVILALSVVHNVNEWQPIADALLEATRKGTIAFIETPTGGEIRTINVRWADAILEHLNQEHNAVISKTLDRDKVAERPLKRYPPGPCIGTPIDGTGGARKHTELWAPHLRRATGQTMAAGTLNIRLANDLILSRDKAASFPIQGGKFYLWPCTLNGYECWIAKPPHSRWSDDVPEIMADVNLREHLSLKNGDQVTLELREMPANLPANLGIVQVGLGKTSKQLTKYAKKVAEVLGYEPFPGSLNVRLDAGIELDRAELVVDSEWGPYRFYPAKINGHDCHYMRPPLSKNGPQDAEFVSDICLRKHFELSDGDQVNADVPRADETSKPLDVAIVTSLYGDYGKFLPAWTRSICQSNRKPSRVTVVISGPTENDAPGIWDKQCVPPLEAAGIPWRLATLPEHQSMGRARNVAVAITQAEWIQYLDVDDQNLPTCLDDVAELAPAADVVSIGIKFGADRRRERDRMFPHVSAKTLLAGRHGSTSLSPYRRCLWVEQPYIESNDWVDGALWVGFAHLGARFVATKRPGAMYLARKDGHFASLSTADRAKAKEQLKSLQMDPEEFKNLRLKAKRQVPVIIEGPRQAVRRAPADTIKRPRSTRPRVAPEKR